QHWEYSFAGRTVSLQAFSKTHSERGRPRPQQHAKAIQRSSLSRVLTARSLKFARYEALVRRCARDGRPPGAVTAFVECTPHAPLPRANCKSVCNLRAAGRAKSRFPPIAIIPTHVSSARFEARARTHRPNDSRGMVGAKQ